MCIHSLAELHPWHGGGSPLAQGLRELQALGLVSGGLDEPKRLAPFTPLQIAGRPLSDTLLEEREDRF